MESREEQLKRLASRKKALDTIKGFRQTIKKGKYFGEKEDELELDFDNLMEADEANEDDSKKNKKEAKESEETEDENKDEYKKTTPKFTSGSTDPTANALNNMQTMSKLTDNPYAQTGAALLGVMQAEQARKEANRKLEAEAKEAEADRRSNMAKIYSKMATSMKGMLS